MSIWLGMIDIMHVSSASIPRELATSFSGALGRTYFLALIALTGCSGSSSGGGAAPPPDPVNSNSSISAIVLPNQISGDVEVRVTVIDPESDPIDLEIDISLDLGQTWLPGRVLDDGSLLGLASSSVGVESSFFWNTLADLGFHQDGPALLRILPIDPDGAGTTETVIVPQADNLRLAAEKVEFHMIHYGAVDASTLALAKTHDLVIVLPSIGNLPRDIVRQIQDGIDPIDPSDDVIVLGYISIGEDLRTIGMSDAEMLLDPRFVGDGTGPRVDPRGPDADGQSLLGIDPLGLPSNGATGYASWYLDDNSVDNDPGGIGDGLPDRNGIFGGSIVNAGDPKWFDVLQDMQIDGVDGIPGLREILTLDYGRGLGCDGVFLDTIDTCAPNAFTDSTSPNQSEFEWTAAGFSQFISRLGLAYPDRIVLQNRGVFLFDPRHPHYAVTTRPYVDFVLFGSYRLNSNTFEEYDPFFFPDNRFNFAPKLMAEANRPDGFLLSFLPPVGVPRIPSTRLLLKPSE